MKSDLQTYSPSPDSKIFGGSCYGRIAGTHDDEHLPSFRIGATTDTGAVDKLCSVDVSIRTAEGRAPC